MVCIGRIVALSSLLAAATIVGCGSHLRLTNTGTTEGPLFVCGDEACETAQTDDPERINREGLTFVALPEGCVEMTRAVLDPAVPTVDVECAGVAHRCVEDGCSPLGAEVQTGARAREIELPAECGGRIHELLIHDATSDQPTIYVQCDVSSVGPIEEM
jgi:hypothetical protein